MPKPVIVSAVRTAIGTSFTGSLVNTPAEVLATTVLQEGDLVHVMMRTDGVAEVEAAFGKGPEEANS